MSAKVFLNSSVKYVPQMDMMVRYTENGGIEASQTFLARKSSLGTSDLNPFQRGTRWDAVWPEVPALYAGLTMKLYDPQDAQPGIIAIRAEFTGYQWASGGSSGDETTVPTTSLRGQLEEVPFSEMKEWADLTENEKFGLGALMKGDFEMNPDRTRIGIFLDQQKTTFVDAWAEGGVVPIVFSQMAINFAKMISDGRSTKKVGGWTYNYRTEGKLPFTSEQLNTLGKIVANPPGEPVKPSSDWTWLNIGPEQSQSGRDRFIKDLNFQLIPDTPENQFLYGS